MSYKIQFDEQAIKYLEKLSKDIRKRIFNKIISTKENPLRYFIRLEGRSYYKLRVGEYRVIADIDSNKQKINITLIGHRRNVYD